MKSFWWDLHKRAFWFDLICFFLEFFPGESGTLIRGYLIGCFFSSVGENPRINRSSYIYFPERVSVGDNLIMNVSCVIQAAAGLQIGHNVSIGPGVKLWTINHNFMDRSQLISQQGWSPSKKIVIGNDVWIAANVLILPNVNIPDGCVIGAGVILDKHVDLIPYGVYVGNPPRLIKQRV